MRRDSGVWGFGVVGQFLEWFEFTCASMDQVLESE